MRLNVRDLCIISLLAALEFVVFSSFTNVLYLECITFVICVVALNFSRKVAVLSALTFTILNLLTMGVTPWSLLYVVIYSGYSLFLSLIKEKVRNHVWIIACLCGFLSFLTGQILQLPFLLVSKKVTIAYLIIGLKTSFLQGIINVGFTFLCYPHIAKVVSRWEN